MHPDAMAAVAASDYAVEPRALAATTAEISPAVDALPGAEAEHPLFNRLVAAWAGEPDDVRRAGVAGDVVLIHIASMSNLFAVLGWALVDLLEHPDECVRGRAAGDRARAEQCALESTRLAQRSIMSCYVVAPVRLETGTQSTKSEPAPRSPPSSRSRTPVLRPASTHGIPIGGTAAASPMWVHSPRPSS